MAGEDEDEDEDADGEMMAVDGQDGQQYVVLEVIQLQDGDGEQAVAVVAGDGTHTMEQTVTELHATESDDEGLLAGQHNTPDNQLTDEEDDMETLRKRIEIGKDMQNCFGFDEGDEEVDDESAETTFQLLEAMH